MPDAPSSFIVQFWDRVFRSLSYASPFSLVRLLLPRTRASYLFVDAWSTAHLVLPGLGLAVAATLGVSTWAKWLAAYGGLRVFEVLVYHGNVLFFDRPRALARGGMYALRSHRRIAILTLQNYVEVLLWLALLLCLLDGPPGLSSAGRTVWAIGASARMLAHLGVPGSLDSTPTGSLAVGLAALIGGLLNCLVLLRLFRVLVPQKETLDPLEREEGEDADRRTP